MIKLSCSSKFHITFTFTVDALTVFVEKNLSKDPEIDHTVLSVLVNILKLGQENNLNFSEGLSNNQRVILAPSIKVIVVFDFF